MTATIRITPPAAAPPMIPKGGGGDPDDSSNVLSKDGAVVGGYEAAEVGDGEGRDVGGREYSMMVTNMLSCITEIALRDAAVSTVIFATLKLRLEAMDVKVLKKLVLLLVFKAAISSFENVVMRLVAKVVATAVLPLDVE